MLYLGASPTEILWKGTKAPVFNRKQLCALLIPLMLEQILASLMGMADTMMVSNVGSHAIAAVSLVDSLNIVMINLFSAMATGGSIICSQYIGRDDLRQANETARQLLLSITAISLVIGAVCLTLRRPLLSLIFGRVEDTVMENAEVYMLVTALSFPFLAMYNAGAALFRASGNSRLPMTVSILSNIINIIGNAILIFGLKMGVLGAAIPTLLGRVFCAVVILYKLRQPHQKIIVHDYRAIRPDFKRIGHILRIGVPTGVENSMFQFGKLVIQSTVSTLGHGRHRGQRHGGHGGRLCGQRLGGRGSGADDGGWPVHGRWACGGSPALHPQAQLSGPHADSPLLRHGRRADQARHRNRRHGA